MLMRACHNHPIDNNLYSAFLETAVKVRKFTKKPPRLTLDAIGAAQTMKPAALASKITSADIQLESNPTENALKQEKKD